MSRTAPRTVLLLLLAAALAGCASNDGAPEGEDVSVDDPEQGSAEGEPTPGTSTPDEPQGDEPQDRLARAFDRFDNRPGHFRLDLENYDATLSRPRPGHDVLYVDSANATTYFLLNSSKNDLTGQVGNVTVQLSESNSTVYAVHNDSIEPFSTVANFSQKALGAQLPLALAYYPTSQIYFMQRAFYVPSIGTPAVSDDPSGPDRTRMTWGQPTGTSTTVVLEDGSERILWLNATQASGGHVQKWGNVTMTYGPAAEEPRVLAVQRAASMAFLEPLRLRAAQVGTNITNSTTWTILGEGAPLVALAEAELRVFDRSDAGEEAPRLALPLEKGEATNADVALAYDDVDGDGMVSKGDTLTVTVKKARQDTDDYDLRLSDELTGWELVAR